MLTNSILLYMQQSIIDSIFNDIPLPGKSQSIDFPDLNLLNKEQHLFLLDENLYGKLSLPEKLNIRTITKHELKNLVKDHLIYIHFQPPKIYEKNVTFTLELKFVSSSLKAPIMGLGGIQVKFENLNENWEVLEEPILIYT